MTETLIGIYQRINGMLEYLGDSFTVEELGGTVPSVGDMLIDPGVSVDADRKDPASRTIQRVVDRYFLPQISDRFGPKIILVVESRAGTPDEEGIFFHN